MASAGTGEAGTEGAGAGVVDVAASAAGSVYGAVSAGLSAGLSEAIDFAVGVGVKDSLVDCVAVHSFDDVDLTLDLWSVSVRGIEFG